MKRHFITLFLILSFTSFAQSNFGLAIGLDNSKFTGDKPDGLTYGFKSGFSAMAFVDFRLSDQAQLSIRPIFGQGGSNAIVDSTIETDDPNIYSITSTYVGLAALVKIFEREKIYAFVGPEINYLLNAEADLLDQTVKLNEQFSDFGFFLNLGAGLNFNMFKQKWAVEWQLNQMLSSLYSGKNIDLGLSDRLRVSRTKLSLLYKFKKK
jgi:hypothetical protein